MSAAGIPMLQKKRKELRSELVQLERQIFDLETSYLEETKESGNIFLGWEAYLSQEKPKIRKIIFNEDRHFSMSSITSPASRSERLNKQRQLSKPQEGGNSARKDKKVKFNKGEESLKTLDEFQSDVVDESTLERIDI